MSSNAQLPQISLHGLQRAAGILQSVWRYYFRLYDLTAEDFFRCFPLLTYFAAFSYQTDEIVEAAQVHADGDDESKDCAKAKAFIEGIFDEYGILTPRIRQELNHAIEYATLETRIVRAETISYSDLKRVLELRSFDFRILHNTFLLLLNRPISEELFGLIHPIEVIVELESDLRHYQQDVKDGKFNCYRMLIKLFGDKAPEYFQMELKSYWDLFEERLSVVSTSELRNRVLAAVAAFKQDFPITAIPDPIIE